MRQRLTVPALLTLAFIAACAEDADTPTGPVAPSATVDQPAGAEQLTQAAQDQGFVPGRVLVRFSTGAPIEALVESQGAALERQLALGTRVLSVPAGRELSIADALSRSPNVEFAEPDYIYTVDVPCETGSCIAPSDVSFGYKWDLHNDGMITDDLGADVIATGAIDADVDWLEAFNAVGSAPLTPTVIGIIDTGILSTHEDLAGKLVAGFDFFDNDPDPADDHGHGTHVAGIAAAHGNNGTGVPGVAWVPEVEIAAAKVCGFLFGFLHGCPSSAIAQGITWATDNGADVINISLGGGSGSAEVQSALQYARQNDVLPFCAAGNDAGPVAFPAAFPECVAVSSTDWGDDLASYSNFGSQVEIAAPGGDFEDPNSTSFILSSYFGSNTQYAWLAGTSMASPQAAGLGGLLHALGVQGDEEKLARMKTTADDLGAAGDDTSFGAGRINVFNAVEDLLGPPVNRVPLASFTSDCPDMTCVFTDTSTDADGTIVSWSWDFGDGNTSTLQNPSHTYASEATYTVTLTVTDDEGATGTISSDIPVPTPNVPPTASFNWSCDDLVCAFTDTSTDADGTIVAWAWDFGDGNTSTLQNPSHTYAAPGAYTVSLTATDDAGDADTFNTSVTALGPNDPPTASFTWSCTGLTCDFVDTSTDADGTITTRQWDFGDGWTSNAQSPSHTYGVEGTYTVTLTVWDDDSESDTYSADVPAGTNQTPAASFSLSCSDLTCDYTDTSTDADGTIASWSWDFGDGNTTTVQNPSHTYAVAGTYTVSLTVTDNVGATDTFSTDVTVPATNQAPSASFTSSCNDLTCDFTDTSTDVDGAIVSWAWDFGDGNTSTLQNPSHIYATGGTYTVSLTVTDDQGATDSFSSDATAVDPNQAPTASFSWSCAGLSCQFTDTSSDPDGSVVSWQWNFGDGWSSNVQNPGHTYGSAGTYTVTLTAWDNAGAADTFTTDVPVGTNESPVASFTLSCTDLTCTFTDTSTDPDGTVVAWSWDFGDGNTSTLQDPSHTYATAGTYTVTLTVNDNVGASDAFSSDVTVPAGNQIPAASFTSNCTDLDCAFTDTSTDPDGTIVSWAWDFGDGNTSTVQNPNHSYASGGTYPVTLTVTDDGGASDAFGSSVTVSPPNQAPVASFLSDCPDLTCVFTDTSTDPDGTVVSWQWTFGDGWSANGQTPSHTYGTPGTYTVTLTIWDDDNGTDTFSSEVTVGPNDPPTAAFTWTCTDLDCAFTDTSTDSDGTIESWQWNFGDGNTSTAQNPSHTYAAGGSYLVTLTVTDDAGDSDAVDQTVTTTEPNQAPTASFTSSCTDLGCSFTDTSSDSDGTIATWAWDFGDGNTSTAQNPSHTYAAAGTYTVTLTATDDDGASDSASSDVTATDPVSITLSAVGYKVRGRQKADLTWSGATSASVDVYRDGGLILTTANDGSETDHIDNRGSGSYSYQVCEAGTTTCSATVTVTF